METLDCGNQGHRALFLPKLPVEGLSFQMRHFLSCSKLPVATAKFWVSVAKSWELLLPGPHSWSRGSNMGTTLLRILGSQLPLPQLVMEPCWERQGKKTWGYSLPSSESSAPKVGISLREACYFLMPAPEPWLRDFCLEVEINCSTESAKSFPKATSFAPQSGLVQNNWHLKNAHREAPVEGNWEKIGRVVGERG